jgi:pyrroloquinoline-quinone synthase
LAALYAYESQIPEVAQTKRAGLKEFYGIADERAISFFRVHEGIDVLHRQIERQILIERCQNPDEQARAIDVAKESAKALWEFLEGITAEYLTTETMTANAGGPR